MLARRELAIVVFAIALALSGRATFAQQIAQQSSDPNTQEAGQNGGASASAGVAARYDSLQLTLKQAVQLGLKQNPERVIARILVAESERNRQIARSVLLPQAGVKSRAALSQYNFQSVEAGPRAAAARASPPSRLRRRSRPSRPGSRPSSGCATSIAARSCCSGSRRSRCR